MKRDLPINLLPLQWPCSVELGVVSSCFFHVLVVSQNGATLSFLTPLVPASGRGPGAVHPELRGSIAVALHELNLHRLGLLLLLLLRGLRGEGCERLVALCAYYRATHTTPALCYFDLNSCVVLPTARERGSASATLLAGSKRSLRLTICAWGGSERFSHFKAS